MSHEINYKGNHTKNTKKISVYVSVDAFIVTNMAPYIVWAGFLPGGDGV